MRYSWLKDSKNDQGFTLIEVLASAAILMIIVSSVLLALQYGRTNLAQSARRNQAAGIASTIAEYIKDTDSKQYGQAFTIQLPPTIDGQPVTSSTVAIPAATAAGAQTSGQIIPAYRDEVAVTPIHYDVSTGQWAASYTASGQIVGYDYTIKVYFGAETTALSKIDCQVTTQ